MQKKKTPAILSRQFLGPLTVRHQQHRFPMRPSQAGSLGLRACRVARFRIVRCSSAVSKPVATDALTQSATAKQEAGNNPKPETGLILDLGIPTLVPEWRKMFAPSTVVTDVTAGITVGCVAVPLSLAIAVASGVPPELRGRPRRFLPVPSKRPTSVAPQRRRATASCSILESVLTIRAGMPTNKRHCHCRSRAAATVFWRDGRQPAGMFGVHARW